MKKFFLGLVLLLTVFVATPALALAADPTAAAKNEVCQGITGQTGGTCTPAQGSALARALKGVLEVISFIAGVAAVIVIIVAGLKYITSGGDTNSISSAKNTLIYAVVGLIVVAMSQVIVRYVLRNVQ